MSVIFIQYLISISDNLISLSGENLILYTACILVFVTPQISALVWSGLPPSRAGPTKGPLNTSWRKLAGIFCIQQDGGEVYTTPSLPPLQPDMSC